MGVLEVKEQLQNDVAASVRAARAFRGLTQEDVASKAGISRTRLALIEEGKANARLDTLAKIITVLGFRWAFGFLEATAEKK